MDLKAIGEALANLTPEDRERVFEVERVERETRKSEAFERKKAAEAEMTAHDKVLRPVMQEFTPPDRRFRDGDSDPGF